MNDALADFAHRASNLAQDLGEDAHALIEERAMADQLKALLPLENGAGEKLALVLGTPVDLASTWGEQTWALWQQAIEQDRATDDVADLVATRLAVLSWAWSTPPASGPDSLGADIVQAWQVEEADVLAG